MAEVEGKDGGEGMMLFKWLWAVVYYDAWWKANPKDWKAITQTKDRFTRAIPFEGLPKKYKKRGTPIHSIKCKVCGESWFTSCKLSLCKSLRCWLKYNRTERG